jgi:hypothetical protein
VRVGEAEGVELMAELLIVDAPTPTDTALTVGVGVLVLVTLGVGNREIELERDFVEVVEGHTGVLVGVLDGELEAEGGGAMQSGAMRLVGESHQ